MLLKIGDLAKRAGLTVRALHHYDAIGLLSPSNRADGGARLYDQHDVIRLHRIAALKQFGWSLPEIQANLDAPDSAPLEIIERQMGVLEQQVRYAQALHDRLGQLREKIASGGDTGVNDWLTLLEMMTMIEKHLSKDDLADLPQAFTGLDPGWAELTTEIEQAIESGVLPENPEAQALAWRWMRLLKDSTGNNATLAMRLKAMQEQEQRAQEINGINPRMFGWITHAFAHARSTLFGKYLNPAELADLRRRQIAHLDQWPPLFAALREQMQAGAAVGDPAVQDLARRWQELFLLSYCGDDAVLEGKVRAALPLEPDLMLGVGIDMALIMFVQQAIMASQSTAASSTNAGPKPSAQRVAVLRAAHQLLEQPLILDDPLALKILGAADQAAVRSNLAQYTDPMTTALRTSLVVRSRLAEDEWEKSASNGVIQYVILGAGLDTYAYRSKMQNCRIFEVDLPSTQQWKRDCLHAAGIEAPPQLTYVPTNFEHGSLATCLAQAGFKHDQPAFFSWLGVVVYLEPEAITETLQFIASCAPGSAVVFDYVTAPALLTAMEKMALEMIAKNVAKSDEPWKTYFDPAMLSEQMHSLGFGAANNLSAEQLHERYLSGRSDGLRVGNIARLMHAVV
ncbi:MAG: SAM-dependent methyltransferase [Pseudomonadota bacterium]